MAQSYYEQFVRRQNNTFRKSESEAIVSELMSVWGQIRKDLKAHSPNAGSKDTSLYMRGNLEQSGSSAQTESIT